MKNQYHSQRNRFIWAAIGILVCLTAISAQTNTFPTTGNVGVGTTSPTQKLEVNGGAVKITGGGLFVDNDQAIRAGGGDQSLVYRSSSNGIWFGSGDPNDFTVLNAGGAERFRLTTNGRAGLGTNSPSAMFDVSNPTGNLWSHWAHSTATTGQNYGILINAGTNSSDFSFRAQNASGSAELFGVRGDGNVGIGTQYPNAALHILKDMGNSVSASLRVRSPNATARTSRIQLEDYNGSTADALIDFVNTDASAANWYLGLGVDTSSHLALRRGGYVGVGITNPVDRFVIRGFNGNAAMEFGNNTFNGGLFGNSIASYDRVASAYKDLRLITDSSNTSLVLKAGGNVGIGTATPGYKLDVSGDINASGLRINGTSIAPTQWSSGSGSISYAGSVGIGATNSGSQLDVFGADDNARFRSSSATGNPLLSLYQADTRRAYLQYANSDSSARLAVPSGSLAFFTGSGTETERLRITPSGNVGIGTANPGAQLDILGGDDNARFRSSSATGNPLISLYQADSRRAYLQFANSDSTVRLAAPNGALTFYTGAGSETEKVRITSDGSMGIGTGSNLTAGYKLDVSGDLKVSGSGNINANGTIEAGNIKAKYQDVAEWVPASEQLSAGTVVVLDSTKSNQVTSSSVSYDTRVAGVVSEQPGIALGEKSEGKVLVATTGRVRVKVDATKGPIHIGDLLVTSDVPGVAMKSEAVNLGGVQFHRPGTLIGKALEPLEKGKGEILVLLSLQ